MKKINWKEIQEFYDNNHTWRDIGEKFNISMPTILKNSKNGNFKSRNKSESSKLSNKLYPRKHTEETKKKLSKIRIKFLEENPDKVPYLLNHYSKGESYPEKYFDKILEKTNLQYTRYCTVNRYELDFAFIDKGIDLEIDGDQHYLDKTIIKSDKRRNKYLLEKGWETIRIKWSNYQKLSKDQKRKYIKDLIDYIDTKRELPILPEIGSTKYNLCECGNKKWKKSKQCKVCSSKKQKKFEVSKEELEKLLKTDSYESLGRKFKVSGKAIKKRAIKYKLL